MNIMETINTTDTPRTEAARFEALRDAAFRADCIPLKLGQELERELNASKDELAEIKETYASIVQQPHFDEREVHCSCVPALRKEVERLKGVAYDAISQQDYSDKRAEIAQAEVEKLKVEYWFMEEALTKEIKALKEGK